MNTLAILINDENDLDLSQFPYQPGQFADGEEANEVADVNQTWLYVELGDSNDTTAAQEQYLDTHPSVLEYTIL
jgi:hypothetical protein